MNGGLPSRFWSNTVVAGFQNAMLAAGVGLPDKINADGRLHRFCGEGDKSGHMNCYYVLYLDGHPAGAFGSWRLGIRETWRAEGLRGKPAELERTRRILQADRERAEAERQESYEGTAEYAARLCHGSKPADPAHSYLVAKRVRPHGLRQRGETLLVPLRDLDGHGWNLQRIGPDGSKRFLKGGRVTGLASPIGDLTDPVRLVICEGWATAATLHEATGYPVLATMTAGNLRPVALAARERWPDAEIIIAADNDRFTKLPDGRENPGVIFATEAAAAAGARLMVPEFPPGVDGTDFNDLTLASSKTDVLDVPDVLASKSKAFFGTSRGTSGVPDVLARERAA